MSTTIYLDSASPAIDSVDASGYSHRVLIPVTGASLGQIRVTFKANSLGMGCSHCSIGKTAVDPNTAATPVELLFSGASGLSLGSYATIVSDWVTLAFTGADTIIVVLDYSSGGPLYDTSGTLNYKFGTSWNEASPSGFTPTGYHTGVLQVETQAGASFNPAWARNSNTFVGAA